MKRKFTLTTAKIIIMTMIIFSFIACYSDRNKIVIQGDLHHNTYQKIYLSKITPDGIFLIDSTKIHQGKFSFKIKTIDNDTCPAFYQLSLTSVNSMNTVVKRGDYLKIVADANGLAKSYTIEGSDDAKLMHQMDRMLTAFMDTLDILYAFYEKHIENDEIRAQVDVQYSNMLSRYSLKLIRFIRQNSNSMVSIPAFYQTFNRRRFLDEQENLELLQLIHHDLKERYPDSENVKFLEQRIAAF